MIYFQIVSLLQVTITNLQYKFTTKLEGPAGKASVFIADEI
jgi:hypothetical protein